jgi:site-specific DNA recombinase
MEENELDITELKYVMYLRRSREDNEGQLKSIPQQKEACERFARYKGIKVVAVIKEEGSAKSPGRRDAFTEMLRKLSKKEYDGILSWHPDRLARNMKEGGEIINMLDEGALLDLKFVTHHFENTPSGKMLLGIAFVMSKQYSDKLSVDVKRGVRDNLKRGLSPTPKYGYRNHEGIYKPDGQNHELIQKAWVMKLEGNSHKEIAETLNSLGYYKEIKKTKRKTYMTPQKLSEMFRDPFYYGVLVQATQRVDLREIYDFMPAVSEDAYFAIQEQSRIQQRPYKTRKRLALYPLKRLLKCHYCGGTMYIAPSTSGDKKTRLLYCRCANAGCPRKEKGIKKSVRMHVVFDFIYDLLDNGLGFTEEEYNAYYGNLKSISTKQKADLRRKLNNRRGVLKKIVQELSELSLSLLKSTLGITAREYGEQEVERLSVQKGELEVDIEKLEAKLAKSEEDVLSLEQFLNLSKNAPNTVKNGSALVKDAICRFIFLNITVGNNEITSYQLKEPFNTLFKQREKSKRTYQNGHL